MKDPDDEINRICNFIKEHLEKTKSNGVIVALSGGLDSAVVAALSAKALGKENVHCYFIRYNPFSLDIDKHHSDLLCKKLGLTYEENRFVKNYSKKSRSDRKKRRVADAVHAFIINNNHLYMFFSNIDAKRRMRHLRKKANKHKCLVSGTTNCSERLIGYFTKFDGYECDIQPLLHLYKTEIVELAKHLGIPDEIMNKAPSAKHWYKDTGLTYQKLDKILKELDKTSIDSYECEIDGVTKEEVSKVIDMVKRAKHKVEFPPCLD